MYQKIMGTSSKGVWRGGSGREKKVEEGKGEKEEEKGEEEKKEKEEEQEKSREEEETGVASVSL